MVSPPREAVLWIYESKWHVYIPMGKKCVEDVRGNEATPA
jgi:hypothetical protein